MAAISDDMGARPDLASARELYLQGRYEDALRRLATMLDGNADGVPATARRRAAHDLSIADNTYETVEASYQLRNLMQNTRSTFEALQKLEAPTFEQIFKNEELRREFENLTRRLEVPSS